MLNMPHGWSKHFTSRYDPSTPLHPNPPPIHPPHGSSRQLILAADVAELLLSSAVASEAFLPESSVRKSSFLSRPRAFPSSAVGDRRQDDDDRGRHIISFLLCLGGWRRHHRNGCRRSVGGGGAESRPRGTAIASFNCRRPRRPPTPPPSRPPRRRRPCRHPPPHDHHGRHFGGDDGRVAATPADR